MPSQPSVFVALAPQDHPFFLTIQAVEDISSRHEDFNKSYLILQMLNVMNTKMKSKFVLALIYMLVIGSCDDKKEITKVQTHDENEMMSLLHSMTDEMNAIKLYVNPGHDFGFLMQVHHKGAITMGNKVLEKGKDETIRAIAMAMISRKQRELPQIQTFLDGHTPLTSEKGMTFDTEAKAALELMNTNADKETLTGDTDHDFAVIMIHHHQSTIDMAQSYLSLGTSEYLWVLAQKMIDDQTAEKTEIQHWLSGVNN
jgi:uncharacterized protein (DUF305 family)